MSEIFGGIVSLDSATEEQLKTVADDLQARLKALKENK
jgi:hypothetical protein